MQQEIQDQKMTDETGDERSIQQETRRFVETISVRGLSKIWKSDPNCLKGFWLISVLLSLAILLWQLSLVFMKYCQHPTGTTFSEGSEQSVFPDVTICNQYPHAEVDDNVFSLDDYQKYFETKQTVFPRDVAARLKRTYKLSYLTLDDFDTVWSVFNDPYIYLLNLPRLDTTNINSDAKIISCYYFGWDYFVTLDSRYPCELTVIWDPYFYNCYTLKVPPHNGTATKDLRFIFYLNNFPKSLMNIFSGDIVSDYQATGALIIVHNPGSIPKTWSTEAYRAGPGTDTRLTITPTNRTRLHMPYGEVDCTDQKYLPYSDSEIYDRDTCVEVCLQDEISKKCNCIVPGLMHTRDQMLQTNQTICFNLSISENNVDNSQAVEDAFCAIVYSAVIHDEYHHCKSICLYPCNEMYYDVQTNVVPWPHKSRQLSFYENFIRNSTGFGDDFAAYEQIYLDQNNANISTTLQRLSSLNLIEQNFVRVHISLNRPNPLHLTDYPAMTFETFLSSVGGCLSLWLGVTIMTFVEVVEYIFNIGKICVRRNKIKSLK